ncbi:lytic murein transglycosylase [Rhizobium sp. L9]|nr:lytic murein transglycosylase [Rhizobium sp. L9]
MALCIYGGRVTPLCPAGHLPPKGGDRPRARSCPHQTQRMRGADLCTIKHSQSRRILPISPLAGEMPGRAEGGDHTENHHPHTP